MEETDQHDLFFTIYRYPNSPLTGPSDPISFILTYNCDTRYRLPFCIALDQRDSTDGRAASADGANEEARRDEKGLGRQVYTPPLFNDDARGCFLAERFNANGYSASLMGGVILPSSC